MTRQTQLDIANQLFSDGQYPAAADAYELYLRTYPKADQIQNVELILGIVYARYLNRYDRAKEVLTMALPKLHAQRDLEMAQVGIGTDRAVDWPTGVISDRPCPVPGYSRRSRGEGSGVRDDSDMRLWISTIAE